MTPGLLRRLRTSPVPGSRAGDGSAEPTAARKRTILVVAYLAVVTTVAVAALAMSAGWSVLVVLAAGAVVLVLSSAAAGKSLARVLSVGVVLLGLAAEEFFASGRNTTLGAALSPWYAALGFQIYEPTSLRLPAVIVVAVVVAVGVVAIPSAQPLARPYLVAAAALAVVAAVSGYLHSGVMGAARSTDFVALILAGIVVGKHLRAIDTALATKGLSVLLTVKALVAVAATAGIDVPSERFVLFYDSVTPWLASAVLLTLIVRRQSIREDVILWLPALVILALSPRRAPLLALAVALLIVGALNREGRARFRLLGLVAMGSLVIGFAGTLPGAIGERVQQALGLVTGSGGDDSTLGHLNDLVIGWQYAIQGPFWGLGPDARQLPRLAAEAQGLYVHNQLLQTWLTVGLLGAVAIAYLVGRAAVAACRALVDLRDTPVVDAVALSLLALAPINFVLFPYLDTTRRWPLLFGVALAFLVGRSVRKALPTTDSPKSAELLPRVRTAAPRADLPHVERDTAVVADAAPATVSIRICEAARGVRSGMAGGR